MNFLRSKYFANPYSLVALLGMTVLYLFFPSINNTLDSFYYATVARDGGELFMPHHLLYNAFGYILLRALHTSSALSVMCAMNALFAGACLWMMRSILLKFIDDKTTAAWLILLGSCYGFMRFATDAEAYIIPLFFALCGSRALLKKQSFFVVSLFISMACLFHQLYVFWWIGLLVFTWISEKGNRRKNIFLYLIAALVVPFVYAIVFYFSENSSASLFSFMFHDYLENHGANLVIGASALMLTPINFVRTFIQVHGYFLPLIMYFKIFIIPVIIAFTALIWGSFYLKNLFKRKEINSFDKKYASIHLVISGLFFLFAFLSSGNAEFMYMLPFLGVLFLVPTFKIRLKPLFATALFVFIWNVSLAIIPTHFLQLNSDFAMARYVSERPAAVFYLRNAKRIENTLEYVRPGMGYEIYSAEKLINMDSLVEKKHSMLSNAFNNQNAFSRNSMVQDYHLPTEENNHIWQIDSISYDLGVLRIYCIQAKSELEKFEQN